MPAYYARGLRSRRIHCSARCEKSYDDIAINGSSPIKRTMAEIASSNSVMRATRKAQRKLTRPCAVEGKTVRRSDVQ